MKKYILYTTARGQWIQDEVAAFLQEISKTKGRGEVVLGEVVVKKKPRNVQLEKDNDGDIKPTWSWFQQTYPVGDYDGVIVHMSRYYRRKWGISSNIGGSRNPNSKMHPEFWFAADEGQEAYRYENMSRAMELLFHEHAHFDEDLDDTTGNLLTQMSVHDFDYRLKKIHLYHYLVDYRGQALREKLHKLIDQVFKLVKKVI